MIEERMGKIVAKYLVYYPGCDEEWEYWIRDDTASGIESSGTVREQRYSLFVERPIEYQGRRGVFTGPLVWALFSCIENTHDNGCHPPELIYHSEQK